jgi:hypothetical protein
VRKRTSLAARGVVVALLSLATVPASPSADAGAGGPQAEGPVTRSVLVPTAIVDLVGDHVGDVSALAARDQSGAQDDPATYVRFLGRGERFDGYRTYTLPGGVDGAGITTITLVANFRGPVAMGNTWTWMIFDWATAGWVRLGDQRHCGGDRGTEQWPCDDLDRGPWKHVQYNVVMGSGQGLSRFVEPSSREIRVRLRARRPGAARLDAELLEIFSNDGATTGARWTPPVGVRWQWQLEGAAGQHPQTGGIAVAICEPPFGGGDCVRPDVFDIDLYVDPQIAGRYGYVANTAAVEAIHASERHAIGYVTAGDIERWRPDYQQFVDFDERCGGCLRGNPFSRRFPDEYWANLNTRRGQCDFMLQMIRARTDRVAAAGFDAIEYDVVDAYAQGRDVVGWAIGADRQLGYNRALAEMAHEDGLAVALKNDGGQIAELLPWFDLAINEQCFQYNECDGGGYPAPAWRAFIEAGKPVLQAEYRIEPDEFCGAANAWGFSAIRKSRNYSLYARPWTPCI